MQGVPQIVCRCSQLFPLPERNFARIDDFNFFARFTTLGPNSLAFLNDLVALDNLPEDDMFAIQPGGLRSAQEELRAVGIGAGIGHRQNTLPSVLEDEVLIGKLLTID